VNIKKNAENMLSISLGIQIFLVFLMIGGKAKKTNKPCGFTAQLKKCRVTAF